LPIGLLYPSTLSTHHAVDHGVAILETVLAHALEAEAHALVNVASSLVLAMHDASNPPALELHEREMEESPERFAREPARITSACHLDRGAAVVDVEHYTLDSCILDDGPNFEGHRTHEIIGLFLQPLREPRHEPDLVAPRLCAKYHPRPSTKSLRLAAVLEMASSSAAWMQPLALEARLKLQAD
jgi:hypothetical protein